MKKIVLLLTALFVVAQLGLKAQTDTEVINFNLDLQAVIEITVDPATQNQTITFSTADQWNNGTWEGNGISTGSSLVYVSSTGNWNMTIEAPDFTGTAGTVPIENLGVWCEATGTNTFGGANTCACVDIASSQALTEAPAPLISNGTGNWGDETANAFVFNWRMGTGDGSMEPTSMLNQLTAGVFTIGTASTTATLTASIIP